MDDYYSRIVTEFYKETQFFEEVKIVYRLQTCRLPKKKQFRVKVQFTQTKLVASFGLPERTARSGHVHTPTQDRERARSPTLG